MADLFHPSGTLASNADSLVVTPESANWEYSGLRVFELADSTRELATGSDEAALLPLRGACAVEVEGRRFELAGRTDVFRERTDFVYFPIDSEVRVQGSGEFAWCTARAQRKLEPAYVPAEAVAVEVRGGGVGTRQINNFMAVEAFEADSLIAVEVITPEGNVSSYPPHKHDERTEVETQLEEIYYFRISGGNGIGLFRAYAADGSFDQTTPVADGDTFLIPKGYHGPAVALPGYHMYYLNVMAGPERLWMFTDDPDHFWQREVIGGQPADERLPLSR